MRTMSQLRLKSGSKNLVTWVETDPRVREGVRLSLKNFDEPARLWDVVAVGQAHKPGDIKRGWHNDI